MPEIDTAWRLSRGSCGSPSISPSSSSSSSNNGTATTAAITATTTITTNNDNSRTCTVNESII